jgi:ParB family chromosome partitioning protein
MGLLEPIVVCKSSEKGKFEILTGQRRFLAHKQLKKKTIMATVLEGHLSDEDAKAISLTENLIRRDLSLKELIDACTSLYKKYGSIKAVSEETGISAQLVNTYVKYDRLIPELKKMVDNGGIDIKAALRAQDAAAAGDEKVSPKEALKIAKEMTSMSGAQQKKLVQHIKQGDETVEDAIENAKTGGKLTQIIVTLTADVHKSLQNFAAQEGTNQDDAAAGLIEEALLGKGFGE